MGSAEKRQREGREDERRIEDEGTAMKKMDGDGLEDEVRACMQFPPASPAYVAFNIVHIFPVLIFERAFSPSAFRSLTGRPVD